MVLRPSFSAAVRCAFFAVERIRVIVGAKVAVEIDFDTRGRSYANEVFSSDRHDSVRAGVLTGFYNRLRRLRFFPISTAASYSALLSV